jgi:hypothetical protein
MARGDEGSPELQPAAPSGWLETWNPRETEHF